jgi:SecD/SecF fusion protein
MKPNLFTRFAIIIVVIILAVTALKFKPLRGGIDLVGGTDLLYELDLSDHAGVDARELAQRVVDTLKQRIDPQGVKNLIWRVVDNGKRIEIQMPDPPANVKKAREAYNQAVEALTATNLDGALINAYLHESADARKQDLDRLAPGTSDRRQLLEQLAAANDAKTKIEADVAAKYPDSSKIPVNVLTSLSTAQQTFDDTLTKVRGTSLDVTKLNELLAGTQQQNHADADKQLQELEGAYPAQKPQIEAVVSAYNRLAAAGGLDLDSPEELQRRLRGSGVLDFRIAPTMSDTDAMSVLTQAREQLKNEGPRKAIDAGAARFRWFEVDPDNGDSMLREGFITDTYAAQHYVLLYDDADRALTHDGSRNAWKIIDPSTGFDPETGGIEVSFKLDVNGTSYFGDLTRRNINKNMCILLDNRALQAPTIRTAITTGSCQITFGEATASRPADAQRKEADALVKMLNAGSLPATLQPEPISVRTISSTLGQDNINAGLRSGFIAVIAVMAFMLAYYTITGMFADIALMINLLILMACMAAFDATFTLPGIAGVVLTLGMAVDANVLINERIREELHKGASLWNAVKQGYDKVFWTIFDANVTTSLTSIVLIAYGSEEVKGFGVTLLIGLLIHMFTALFVTRTLMVWAMKAKIFKAIDDLSVAEYFKDIFTGTWLKGRWPFMRVITVTNIDWISKRYIFWGVSAVITIAGLVALFARGRDAYDTEFNGGTKIDFVLQQGKTLSVENVRKRITDIPNDPSLTAEQRAKLRDLAQASVQEIGTGDNSFEIVTTIADTATDKRKQLLVDEVTKEFADVIQVTPRVHFADETVDPRDADTLVERSRIVPINRPTLDAVLNGAPPVSVTNFQGGAAIVLDGMNPPQTAEALEARIKTMRQAPDTKAPYRNFTVIPLTAANGGSDLKTAPLTRAVVVVAGDQDLSADTERSKWINDYAAAEWGIVRDSLATSSGLQGVTSFDSQVAGDAKENAVVSIVISLILIVIYVWVRFGGIRYGLGAILSLMHDAIVAVAATVLAGYVANTSVGKALLISDFKINLTMIAAYLTIIGYSVNDTIVIFDRIRENRGRSRTPLSAKLINDSINQCFGRTIWTTFTVFIVVLIMYIFGGEGIRGFSFAMLIGVFTGAYSTLAIASPMLLHAKEKEPAPTTDLATLGSKDLAAQ